MAIVVWLPGPSTEENGLVAADCVSEFYFINGLVIVHLHTQFLSFISLKYRASIISCVAFIFNLVTYE